MAAFVCARVLRNMPNVLHGIGFWTIDPAVGWGLGSLLVTNGLHKPRLHGPCGHQLQNRGVRHFAAMFHSVEMAVVPRFYRSVFLDRSRVSGRL